MPHCIQLRPSFDHLDQARLQEQKQQQQLQQKDPSPNQRSGKTTPTPTATLFRRRETEEQMQARLNSYAHLQRQVDDEQWIPLQYASLADSEEARSVANRLFTTETTKLTTISPSDYSEQLLK